MTVVVTMAKLLFAMVLGFFLNKKGILDEYVSKKISALIINVTCPLLILTSVTSLEGSNSGDIWLLLIAGAVTYLILPFLSLLIAKLVRAPKDCMGVYRSMIMFSNSSFMGYPVVEALYGPFAIFYSTIFHFGFNILFFSYGTFVIAKDAGDAKKFEAKRLVNGGMIAGVLALIIYFCHIPMPSVVVEPLKFIGNVTTPLSMLVIGSNMANCNLKEVFTEKRMYIMTAIRLIVMPLIAFLAMRLITNDPVLIGIVTITMGMPVGSLVAMGASAYEKQGKVASIVVVLSTILSMITIPIMAVLLNMLK